MKEVNHMAVKMRLKRMGKKRNPIYRIVVADEKAAKTAPKNTEKDKKDKDKKKDKKEKKK